MKKEIYVVGAVIRSEKSVLAAQRSATMSLPGLWEFPGGKIEEGETPEEALAREISEELQCSIRVGAAIETTRHEYDFGIVTLKTFYATLLEGTPQLTEHADVRWLTAAELDLVDWAPADIPAVTAIKRDLSESS